ncbi:MAG: hypothetical protein PHV55_02020 [Candidatus Omnitrophica bacterium]|nr:hypothetical protein [Candidatus Omnitrophota bacterium]
MKKIVVFVFLSFLLSFGADSAENPVVIKIQGKPRPPQVSTEPVVEEQGSMMSQGYFAVLPMPSQTWLRKQGISVERDPFFIYDGDFTFLGKWRRALFAREIYTDMPEILKEWQALAQEAEELPFPWETMGSVRLVYQNGNALAELKNREDGETSLSQKIVFKNKDASLEFDLYVISEFLGDVLEVLVAEPFAVNATASTSEVLLASFKLVNRTSPTNLSVNFATNESFVDFLKKNPRRPIRVVFRLKGDAKKTTTIQLDNIVISYR